MTGFESISDIAGNLLSIVFLLWIALSLEKLKSAFQYYCKYTNKRIKILEKKVFRDNRKADK